MSNQEIYDAALRLIGETSNLDFNEDYRDRAPYLISAVCHRYAALDALYRQAHGLDKQKLLEINNYPLPTLFPLSDAFAPPVSMEVAGLLVLAENPKMSEHLTSWASNSIAELQRSIPFKKEKIQSAYAF